MATSTSSSTNTLSLIGVLLILAAGAGAYMFQTGPLNDAVVRNKALQAEQQGKAQDISALTTASSELTQKENDLAAAGITKDSLAAVMPATEDVPGLYLQMEALMQNSSSSLSKPIYQIGQPSADSGQVQIPVTVSATGKYLDLKNFLATLETATRPLIFTTVSFAPPADGAASDTFSLTAAGYATAIALSPAYTAAAPTN